jgi:hypothetical protein
MDMEAAVFSEQLVITHVAAECHNLEAHSNLSFVSYLFAYFLKKMIFTIAQMAVYYLFRIANMTEDVWDCHFNFTNVLK